MLTGIYDVTPVCKCFHLTHSFVLLSCTNHLFSDGCICWDVPVTAAALLVSNNRDLHLLQRLRSWQRLCQRTYLIIFVKFQRLQRAILQSKTSVKSSPFLLVFPQPVAQHKVALKNWLELLARQMGLMKLVKVTGVRILIKARSLLYSVLL